MVVSRVQEKRNGTWNRRGDELPDAGHGLFQRSVSLGLTFRRTPWHSELRASRLVVRGECMSLVLPMFPWMGWYKGIRRRMTCYGLVTSNRPIRVSSTGMVIIQLLGGVFYRILIMRLDKQGFLGRSISYNLVTMIRTPKFRVQFLFTCQRHRDHLWNGQIWNGFHMIK